MPNEKPTYSTEQLDRYEREALEAPGMEKMDDDHERPINRPFTKIPHKAEKEEVEAEDRIKIGWRIAKDEIVQTVIRPFNGKERRTFEELKLVKDGEELSLLAELPEGYSAAVQYGYASITFESKLLKCPHPQSPAHLIRTLHEIGHAIIHEQKSDDEKEREIDAYKKLHQRRFLKALSPEEQQLIIKTERDAWARALKIVRKINHAGFTVFKGIKLKEMEALLGSRFRVLYGFDLDL